jgi:hypothetical protein
MEYTVDYLPDKKIVSVKMTGRLNFQIAEKYSKDAIKLAHEYKCTRFLFDHTETTKQSGVGNIHMIGEELQQFGFKNTDKIAIVVANLVYDDNSQEHVNQNSRWSVLKYFSADNIQETYSWLLEDE